MSFSGTELKIPGIKGKRVPGRPGRFDPSEPLHMTTRRKAKRTSVTNGTPSINGSTEDDTSRRGSLDELRPGTSYSQLSQASPNLMPLSDANELATVGQQPLEPTRPPTEDQITDGMSRPLSPSQQAVSPSRKRKRSSASPHPTPNGMVITASPAQVQDLLPSDEEYAVELVHPDQLSDREVSIESSHSDEDHDNGGITVAGPSVDISPALSAGISPASSVSGSAETQHTKSVNEVADIASRDAGLEVPVEEEDLDEADEVDEQARSEDDGRIFVKRGGKRRRAEHPNAKVEVAMRRQLANRKAFRTVARELKNVLAEISQRTLDDLATRPDSYKEAAEHDDVAADLLAALEERKAAIETQHKIGLQLLKQKMLEEQEVRRSQCGLLIEKAQQSAVDQLQHDLLVIVREARQHDFAAGNETEDEDDVVPKAKKTAYHFKRGAALDPIYESRSRLAIETELSVEGVVRQMRLHKTLQALDEDDRPVTEPPFAVMDRTKRDATLARQEEIASTNFLAEAALEVKRIDDLTIPNDQAIGLQLLGDLCTRPSITALPKEHITSRQSKEPTIIQRNPRQPPPPIVPPTNNPPIAVELSPRTRQIFRDRYGDNMPPPLTPRQAEAFGALPEGPRFEPLKPSPTMQPERTNGLPQLAARPPDSPQRKSAEQSPALTRQDRQSLDRRFSQELQGMQQVQPSPRPNLLSGDREQAVTGSPDRRPRSVDERSPFDFLSRPRLPFERPASTFAPLMDHREREKHREHQPFSPGLLHNRPPLPDRPKSPDVDNRDIVHAGFPFGERPRQFLEPAAPPRPRKPSVDIKDEVRDEGSQASEQPRPAPVRTQPQWPKKTNKAERGGAPRPRKRKRNFEKTLDRQASGVAPGNAQHNGEFANSPVEHKPQLGWLRTSTHPPSLGAPPPHTMAPPPLSPHYGAPPPQHHPYGYGPQDDRHRNSYPPPGYPGGHLRSPLYAIPQQEHQPPPPGVDHYQPPQAPPPPPGVERYQSFPPPPPPHYHPHGPPTPQPMSGPGPYGQQFGGPAIAPATPDMRYNNPPGFRAVHPPAFAQRHGDGSRRRTQSDAHTRQGWKTYNGPNPRS